MASMYHIGALLITPYLTTLGPPTKSGQQLRKYGMKTTQKHVRRHESEGLSLIRGRRLLLEHATLGSTSDVTP